MKKPAPMKMRMKNIRIDISLYVIIPVVFAGIAVLSITMAYNVSAYYQAKNIDPGWPMVFWGMMLVLLACVCGLVIVRVVLKPLEQFAKKAERLGVLRNAPSNSEKNPAPNDDMSRYTRIFEQVTEILSKVESRELFPQVVGQSKAVRGVFNQIMKVAPTDASVLVCGETGTGKELITRSLHEHSPRKDKPFVAINCAAIPQGLLESELFGHEKGAFTGATTRKPGKFELADGGTLFMDEIGDMPLETQAKLLRVIQEGQIERVGGVRPISVNVRFVAATNKDLAEMVEQGRFRQDLFFRLNGFTIQLPPLRERREDIPVLVEHFTRNSKPGTEIAPETMQLLAAYHWPGNVRELKNTIEAACVMAAERVEPQHLPAAMTRAWSKFRGGDPAVLGGAETGLDQRMREIEKGLIIEALTRTNGVQVTAANLLGIKERSLWHRVKKHDIDIASFKGET